LFSRVEYKRTRWEYIGAAGSRSWLKAELGRRVTQYWTRPPGPEAPEGALENANAFRMFPYGKALNMATCWGTLLALRSIPAGLELIPRPAPCMGNMDLLGQRRANPGTHLRQQRIDEAREDRHDRQWVYGKSGVLAVWIWVCLSMFGVPC
jgi:hypothetical protein